MAFAPLPAGDALLEEVTGLLARGGNVHIVAVFQARGRGRAWGRVRRASSRVAAVLHATARTLPDYTVGSRPRMRWATECVRRAVDVCVACVCASTLVERRSWNDARAGRQVQHEHGAGVGETQAA